MSLLKRIRSLRIWKPIGLVFLVGFGVFTAYGLVVHLWTGTSMLADPDEPVSGLMAAGCGLIYSIVILIPLVAVPRRQEPVAATFGRDNRLYLWGLIALLLGSILYSACRLIAPLSFPVAWHIETGALILWVLGPALMLLAAWRKKPLL